MRKIFVLLTAAFALSATSASAQTKTVGGEFAAGIRIGSTIGATVKKYNGLNTSAIELIAQFDNFTKDNEDLDGFTLHALWEKLAPLSGSTQLSAIIGGGPSFNFKDDFNFGVSGMVGFDWRFKAAPVSLQVDWMPTYFFVNTSEFELTNGAISIRYILNNRKKKK